MVTVSHWLSFVANGRQCVALYSFEHPASEEKERERAKKKKNRFSFLIKVEFFSVENDKSI
jgi:hypothetical protein